MWASDDPARVLVGANRRQMLRMATHAADGVMMSDVTLARMSEVMQNMGDGFAAHGRSPQSFRVNNFWAWHIKEDPQESVAEARQELVWRGVLQRWYTESFLSEKECDLVEKKWAAFLKAFLDQTPEIEAVPDSIIEALVDNLSFSGGLDSVDTAAERIRQFSDAGLTEIALRLHRDPAAAIRIIGEHLLPALG